MIDSVAVHTLFITVRRRKKVIETKLLNNVSR